MSSAPRPTVPSPGGPRDGPSLASFWKRLSRLMSKVNPEPNVVHIMGCYILGNPNGEKVRDPQAPPRLLETPVPREEFTEAPHPPRFSPDAPPPPSGLPERALAP